MPTWVFERGGLRPAPWRSWGDVFSSLPARPWFRGGCRLRQTRRAPHSILITAVVPGHALSSTAPQSWTSPPFLRFPLGPIVTASRPAVRGRPASNNRCDDGNYGASLPTGDASYSTLPCGGSVTVTESAGPRSFRSHKSRSLYFVLVKPRSFHAYCTIWLDSVRLKPAR